MVSFESVFSKVNSLLTEWGEGGIDLAGETDKEWIFKGHKVKGDKLSGSCIIVEKSTGEMRLFNAGRFEDREVTYNAKILYRYVPNPKYTVSRMDIVETHPGWTDADYEEAIKREEERCKGIKDWSELDPDNEVLSD